MTEVEVRLPPNSSNCALITIEWKLNLCVCRGETINNGTQIRQGKDDVLMTEVEVRSMAHLVFYIEPFIQWRKQNVGLSAQSLAKVSTDIETSNWVRSRQTRKKLPAEIQKLVNTNKVKTNKVSFE